MDKQTITGNGGTSYTLDHAVANVNEIEVFVNNVRQEPSVAYTVAGTALTMTGNVASSDDFYVVFQGKALQTVVPPDGSVTSAKLASGAAASNLGTSVNLSTIKDSTGTNTAVTIDSSGFMSIANALVGNNTVYGWNALSSTSISNNSTTIINLSTTNHANHKVTVGANNRIIPTVAGRYFVFCNAAASGVGSSGYSPTTYIYKNGSNYSATGSIRYYPGSSTVDFPTHFSVVAMNGTTDYFQLALYQNSGNTFTINSGSLGVIRIGD